MKLKAIAGHRQRGFKPRSDQVPEVVHTLMEFIHDMCLELGVCPSCKLRLLHQEMIKGKRKIYSKCLDCLTWHREYSKKRMKS